MARKILRYRLDEQVTLPDDTDIATIKVGGNPVVRHVGTGTSPALCAWVEVDVDEAGEATSENELRIAIVNTGKSLPDGTYVGFCRDLGPIQHFILLAS